MATKRASCSENARLNDFAGPFCIGKIRSTSRNGTYWGQRESANACSYHLVVGIRVDNTHT